MTSSQTIQLLPEQFNRLATHLVDEHYKTNKNLEKKYGVSGKQKCIDDAIIHLTYLHQAIENNSERLFTDYILWAKTLFEGIHIPVAHLIEHLTVMSDVLLKCLAQDQAQQCCAIIQTALQSLDEKTQTTTTFLLPTQTHYELAQQYLSFLIASNRTGASQLILKAVQNDNISVQDIYLDVFQPCQREVGLLWQTGRLSVAQEHFCTAATQLCMSQLYPFIFNSKKNGYVAVITCVEDELHEIGVRMVADLLEMNGWDAFYLGANTPSSSVLQFIKEKKPNLVGISATITSHLPQVKRLIEEIRNHQDNKICVMVGGYPFNLDEKLWQEIGADASSCDAKSAINTAFEFAESLSNE